MERWQEIITKTEVPSYDFCSDKPADWQLIDNDGLESSNYLCKDCKELEEQKSILNEEKEFSKVKTIYDIKKSEKLRKEAEDFVYKIYKENRETYEEALKLITKLGLGGLWQGTNLALQEVIKTIQGVRK